MSEAAHFSPLDSLIGREPGWLVRAGIGLVGAIVFALLMLAALVPYPRTLNAPVLITSAQPPLAVVAPRAATVARWAVAQGDVVRAGQLLAVLDSDADSDGLLALEQDLVGQSMDAINDDWIGRLEGYRHYALGSARAAYDEWLAALHEFQLAQQQDFAGDRLRLLQSQQAEARTRQQRLEQQLAALDRSLILERQQLEQIRELHQRRVIAAIELNRAEQRLLDRQLQRDDAAIRLDANRSEIQRYEEQTLAMRERYALADQNLRSRLVGGREGLLAAIQTWRRKHLLHAPIGGEIAFGSAPREHQFVQLGEPLLRIVPPAGELLGQVKLPQFGAGEVDVGQPVLIELDSYPAAEHGAVDGEIVRIAPLAVDGFYQLDIAFPQGLVTRQGVRLPVTANLEGLARIRLADRSLLTTLFSGLTSMFQ